jgi:hypothetical protein
MTRTTRADDDSGHSGTVKNAALALDKQPSQPIWRGPISDLSQGAKERPPLEVADRTNRHESGEASVVNEDGCLAKAQV